MARMPFRVTIAGFSVLCVLAVATASGQSGQGGTAGAARPPQDQMAPIDPDADPVLRSIRDAVDPTDDQVAQIVKRYEQFREARTAVVKAVVLEARRGGIPLREQQVHLRKLIEARMQPVIAQFLDGCRSALDASQKEAFDACAAALDLMPGGRAQRPAASKWADPKRGPKVGEKAPLFELADLEGKPVALSSLLDRPVVLLFGSYSCPIFRANAPRMKKLQAACDEKVRFVLVYTFESHPVDGDASPLNAREGIEVRQHTTMEQRRGCAALADEKLQLELILLLDDMANTIAESYCGHPNRGYVIDGHGLVVSKHVWAHPDKLRRDIESLLGEPIVLEESEVESEPGVEAGGEPPAPDGAGP